MKTKRFLLIAFAIICVFLFTSRVQASKFTYKWENTYIDVPINSSIYNYSSLPKAKLYIDSKELSDAHITYNSNGDWLYYLKDVNTSKPGKYQVWYKAIEDKYKPGTCENYKQKITFNVYDDIKPQIYLLQDEVNIEVKSNLKALDFKSYYTIVDNLENDVKDSINLDFIDFNRVGTYEALIKAVDSSGNTDAKSIRVNVVDSRGPIINFLGKEKKLVLEKGKEIDWHKYFQAIDNVDGDVSNSIIIDGFDANKIGLYSNVIISFSDHEGNVSSYQLEIEVVDLIFPTLELNQQQVTMQYETPFDPSHFTKYIREANDNGINMFDDVKIDLSELENKVGSYTIHYELTDSDGNLTKRDLKVNLVSLIKPNIRVENKTIFVGDSLDINGLYYVTDDSDPNVMNNVKIDDGNFDASVPGIYYVTVTAYNSSGLFNNAVIEINVLAPDVNNAGFGLSWFKILILILLALIIGAVLVFYLIKRKKEKSFIDVN